jgi:uncharacterized protein (DUF1778 family)
MMDTTRDHAGSPDTARLKRRGVKRGRLATRITEEQKILLQRAADIQGRSLSDFVIESAQRVAEAVIRAHEVITLSTEDSRAFAEALLNPPAPNERLREAFARYQQEVVEH